MRDAYALLRRAEDHRCVTKGSTMWAAVHSEAALSQGIEKPYFLVQAGGAQPGEPTGWDGGGSPQAV